MIHPSVSRVLAWLGRQLPEDSVPRLQSYATWLETEAIAAGGLGPAEATRIWDRHIADSLVLAAGWREGPPPAMADLGSGVGLPGIPLALLFPDTKMTLIDRSGRRCRLVRRVVRMLEVDIEVVHGDVDDLPPSTLHAVVSRATLPLPRLIDTAARVLNSRGTAMFAASRGADRPVPISGPEAWDVTWVSVPENVLDSPVWLLRMQRRDDRNR